MSDVVSSDEVRNEITAELNPTTRTEIPAELKSKLQTKPLYAMITDNTQIISPVPLEIVFPEFQTVYNRTWNYNMIVSIMNAHPTIQIFTIINEDFRHYLISCYGEAWSLKCNRLLAKTPKDGYLRFKISNNGNKNYNYRIQRAVIFAFLSITGKVKSVHHIDANPLNNDLRNLFPTNQRINSREAHRNPEKLSKCGIPVEETNKDGHVKIHLNIKMCYEDHQDMIYMRGNTTYLKIEGRLPHCARLSKYLRENETVTIKDSSERIFQLKRMESRTTNKEEDKKEYIPKPDEVWKPVIDITVRASDKSLSTYNFPEYEVSNYGMVRSFKYGEINMMTPQFTTGYYKITFRSQEHREIEFLISRLVLFLHGTEKFVIDKGQIIHYYDLIADHKSRNTNDNSLSNLQWVTGDFNCELIYIRAGKRNNCIAAYDVKGNLLAVFASSYVLKKLLVERVSSMFEDLCIKNQNRVEGYYKYYGIVFKYITREFYHQNKDKNLDFFLCKPHDGNYKITLEQYELLTNGSSVYLGRFINSSGFRPDIESKVGNIGQYHRKNRKPYFGTILTYQDIIRDGFIWRIIYGKIVITTKHQIKLFNDDFEVHFPEIDSIIAASVTS
ncbi:MAG: putative HNH endonuclease [Solivirus sp.]|uniref:Putative HNH endonuclease n=1 Tax=Solivirus sp. TaxID=2487772 RepID=A0A3G5AID1_9VIRU|nr:MAG: putative HNH endonuclease [Solivirus sp.]